MQFSDLHEVESILTISVKHGEENATSVVHEI